MDVPAWVPGRTFYQLHTLGAAGAPAANPDVGADAPSGRGLRRLEPWLDHVAGLGCGGVLLTPLFVSSSHGYDTVDPLRIDQRLGDEKDFASFAQACRTRDLKLILDGVLNHVGRDFPAFRDVLARGSESGYAGWFRLNFSRDGGDGFAYRDFEGHHELVALNHDNGEVLAWADAVLRYWLDRGTDGWRLDAAYALPPLFLAVLSERIRKDYPDVFLFGEVIHGDYVRFVTDSGLDAVTQYELHKAIWSSLNDGNFFELAWALARHREFVSSFAPVTFAGNHDVTRLASQLRDPRHLGPALAVLFTVPGIPCVYYGDEFGWRGRKEFRSGGDDAIRPPLPASPDPPGPEAAQTLRLHTELIAMRRARPWLTGADVEVTDLSNERITYTVSGPAGALLVVLAVTGPAAGGQEGWTPVLAGDGWAICER
jgi:glycosidase